MRTGSHYLWLVILLLAGELVFAVDAGNTVGKSETKEDQEVDVEDVTGRNKTRVKRYPEHLDPNNYPFWVRIGECPSSLDGGKQHFCPTPTTGGRWVCVDDYQLCDGIKNCPNSEDEDSNYCLFYKVLKSEVEMLQKSISTLRKEEALVEGQKKNNLVFEIDENDGDVGVKGEEAFESRFHRQSGPFRPAH